MSPAPSPPASRRRHRPPPHLAGAISPTPSLQRHRPPASRRRHRPPLLAGASAAIDLARRGDDLRGRLVANAHHFRGALTAAGFELLGEDHPIIPIMLGDATLAQRLAATVLDRGVYVTAFSYPVVPRATARIHTQMSAAHTSDQVDRAVTAFVEAGRELGVIG
ncbi:MAG: aminotransferase class I/II-fold pyridoxal phosphate-dependent enzyme [Acidimicrobiales bacterium]